MLSQFDIVFGFFNLEVQFMSTERPSNSLQTKQQHERISERPVRFSVQQSLTTFDFFPMLETITHHRSTKTTSNATPTTASAAAGAAA